MNYNCIVKQFKKDKVNKSIRLLKWTRIIFYLVSKLNWLDGIALKMMIILFGFQYDIYIKLHEVSYNNDYLVSAEKVKHQIELTINAIGE